MAKEQVKITKGTDYSKHLVTLVKSRIPKRQKKSRSRVIKQALLFTAIAVIVLILFVSLKGMLLGEKQIAIHTNLFSLFTTGEEVVSDKPQVEVEYNLMVVENDQKSVDGGHSPWKLDPIFVTQVFASLLLTPEGIVGDYPIAYDDIQITSNNGTEAIAQINSKASIASYVYLKRLIRQDDTGIWTVIGYDLAK